MLANNKIFNHLKIHTQYSICEGAIKIEDLKNFCKKNKILSVGLSDSHNLCGSLEFSENIYNKLLWLPSGNNLSEEQLSYICKTISNYK